MKRLLTLAAAFTLLAVPLAGGAQTASYGPPYADGPQGGDGFNTVLSDPQTGEMTVVRHYPIPGGISCGGSGAFVHFEVTHDVDAPVSEVRVAYEATIDNFTWIEVTVRNDGISAGHRAVRGPALIESGTLVVAMWDLPQIGDTLTIHFGLTVASSCPSVGGGTARFPAVTVG